MWNHRVIQKEDSGGIYFEIHEVHYNDDCEIWGMTEKAVTPFGDTVEELEASIDLMRQAVGRTVLVEADIEYKEE